MVLDGFQFFFFCDLGLARHGQRRPCSVESMTQTEIDLRLFNIRSKRLRGLCGEPLALSLIKTMCAPLPVTV